MKSLEEINQLYEEANKEVLEVYRKISMSRDLRGLNQ